MGWADIPFWHNGARDFYLPRPPATALREYVPGNLIYANGHRFVARQFHRDPSEEHAEMPFYEISAQRHAVKETSGTTSSALGSHPLQVMAVCDTDLIHASHISDEEDLRFQLRVAIFGLELKQHSGGRAYRWGPQRLHIRRGVRMRLVNVGTSSAGGENGNFGYPVCTVCGQSVSPLSSQRQREEFSKSHSKRCGREPKPIGFYADVVADTLSLPACDSATTAYSVLEAMRFAAARILDMHMGDLQILVIGHVDREDVDAVLWDPMPGGSGLLERIRERFVEIAQAAREVVDDCPSSCKSSCIDCLQTFRNAYYHQSLDRSAAREMLSKWGGHLSFEHKIPPEQPSPTVPDGSVPVNEAETKLRHLLSQAGLPDGIRGEQIWLGPTLGSTTPDVIYRAAIHDPDEGVCIYLDGMSSHLHGNPATARKDRQIRTWLRNQGYDVIEIAANELDDQAAMVRHIRRIANLLSLPDVKRRVVAGSAWFRGAAPATPSPSGCLRLVVPSLGQRYVSCVPLIPLQAAAGEFGDPHALPHESEWEWVEVETTRSLRSGMFVAQVVGKSMEPRIPSGSYCLFSYYSGGTRQGRVVLVKLQDEVDPETGDRFTVKRYRSKKAADSGGWRHIKITLEPINQGFDPIELTTDDEKTVHVVAELVDVIGQGPPGPTDAPSAP